MQCGSISTFWPLAYFLGLGVLAHFPLGILGYFKIYKLSCVKLFSYFKCIYYSQTELKYCGLEIF